MELGIAEVWDMIDRYFDFVRANGYFDEKRRRQARFWMYESIDEQLRKHFYDNPEVDALLRDNETEVLANRRSSFAAAAKVLDYYFRNKNNR